MHICQMQQEHAVVCSWNTSRLENLTSRRKPLMWAVLPHKPQSNTGFARKFKLSDRNIQKVFSQLSEYNEIVDG